MRIFYFVIICLSLSARLVTGHELPLSTVYPNKSVVVAVSFSLTASEIEQAYSDSSQYFDFASWTADNAVSDTDQRQATDDCSKITHARTCGQVDEFFMAATVAMMTCHSFAVLQKAHYAGGLVPRFTSPSSFVTGSEAAIGHHMIYDLSQGISFDCVYPLEEVSDDSDRREERTR